MRSVTDLAVCRALATLSLKVALAGAKPALIMHAYLTTRAALAGRKSPCCQRAAFSHDRAFYLSELLTLQRLER